MLIFCNVAKISIQDVEILRCFDMLGGGGDVKIRRFCNSCSSHPLLVTSTDTGYTQSKPRNFHICHFAEICISVRERIEMRYQENHSKAAMFNSNLVEGGVELVSTTGKTWVAPDSDPSHWFWSFALASDPSQFWSWSWFRSFTLVLILHTVSDPLLLLLSLHTDSDPSHRFQILFPWQCSEPAWGQVGEDTYIYIV